MHADPALVQLYWPQELKETALDNSSLAVHKCSEDFDYTSLSVFAIFSSVGARYPTRVKSTLYMYKIASRMRNKCSTTEASGLTKNTPNLANTSDASRVDKDKEGRQTLFSRRSRSCSLQGHSHITHGNTSTRVGADVQCDLGWRVVARTLSYRLNSKGDLPLYPPTTSDIAASRRLDQCEAAWDFEGLKVEIKRSLLIWAFLLLSAPHGPQSQQQRRQYQRKAQSDLLGLGDGPQNFRVSFLPRLLPLGRLDRCDDVTVVFLADAEGLLL